MDIVISNIFRKFENKFDVGNGNVYGFKVTTIKIISFFLVHLGKKISSFKYVISNFWRNYCCLYFPLNFNFKKNSQKESSSCKNSSPKSCWVQGEG